MKQITQIFLEGESPILNLSFKFKNGEGRNNVYSSARIRESKGVRTKSKGYKLDGIVLMM